MDDRKAAFVAFMIANPTMVAAEAARQAGYGGKNPQSARVAATRLMKDPGVREAIAKAQAERAAKLEITADMVVERLWAIATADPNELMQYRRNACRYCHGVGHAFQWVDEAEWHTACQRAEKRHQPKPDNAGGYGFSEHGDVNPHCPRCNGEGAGQAFFADTRRLKGAARLLYAGVKEGRDGMEMKIHDQQAAMRDLCKLLGFIKDKHEHSGPEGSPIEHRFQSLAEFQEAARKIASEI